MSVKTLLFLQLSCPVRVPGSYFRKSALALAQLLFPKAPWPWRGSYFRKRPGHGAARISESALAMALLGSSYPPPFVAVVLYGGHSLGNFGYPPHAVNRLYRCQGGRSPKASDRLYRCQGLCPAADLKLHDLTRKSFRSVSAMEAGTPSRHYFVDKLSEPAPPSGLTSGRKIQSISSL
jgi:hypothetical protein